MTPEQVIAHCLRHSLPVPPELTRLERGVPEGELLTKVRGLAKALGWLEYHTYRSDRSPSGFPDLVLVKPGRLIFAELKQHGGKLTHDQEVWLSMLRRSVSGVEVELWRPEDFGRIVITLQGREDI